MRFVIGRNLSPVLSEAEVGHPRRWNGILSPLGRQCSTPKKNAPARLGLRRSVQGFQRIVPSWMCTFTLRLGLSLTHCQPQNAAPWTMRWRSFRRSRRPTPFPHASRVRGAGTLFELRPRTGRSKGRAFYRQVGATVVIAAIGPEATVDARGFARAVKVAQQRLNDLEGVE